MDSSPATGKDGENAEVEKKRNGRAQIPDPCPALTLLVPPSKFCVWHQDALDSCGGCRKLRLHLGRIPTRRGGGWVVVAEKRIEGWVASHLVVSSLLCLSPTQEQVFCLLMRIVVEILSESPLWSSGRKAAHVTGWSTSFGGALVRCQM